VLSLNNHDELDGFTVPHVKLEPGDERFCSDVGSYLNQTLKPLFVVMITTDGQYHLRSDKNGSNFDLIPIAKKYGGGGHPNAAGFIKH
jgi:oligoribonuclease NrnB/cAMP/cGMP phosphodiesterase (DHH superfamily)